MSTIFSQIIARKIPAFIVAENDQHIAFLDIAPIRLGHTLVVAKEAIDYFFSMSEEKIASFMAFAKQVALAIEEVIPCKRIGIGVLGLEVPHVHMHLVPLHQARDFNFTGPKVEVGQEVMQKTSQNIAHAFAKKNKPSQQP